MKDDSLAGALDYERLMHPRTTATWKELSSWLKAHGGEAGADRIHALALRRSGKSAAAADPLGRLLDLAQGRSMDELVPGPEPLSLEFYVNSARSFLESEGSRP